MPKTAAAKTVNYGLEQARAPLPHIASEAVAGSSSVITRHGKPVAVVVPVNAWQALQAQQTGLDGILALRGTGQGIWPSGTVKALAQLRDEREA